MKQGTTGFIRKIKILKTVTAEELPSVCTVQRRTENQIYFNFSKGNELWRLSTFRVLKESKKVI